MSHDIMIEMKDFSVQLGNFHLQNINLSVERSEIFALLGKTGSGKTVLLESIAGFYKGKTGIIQIERQKVTELPLEARGIGFVYQDFGLFPHMTALENISYGLKMKKVPKDQQIQIVEELADILSIRHILKQYPETLSGGERQRTSLARALVLKPKILLMDEPFSALDPVTKQAMYNQVREIHAIFGCTILFVTHDFTEAQMMADRIGIMVQGKLKAVRKKENLFQQSTDSEIDAFLGIENQQKGEPYDISFKR